MSGNKNKESSIFKALSIINQHNVITPNNSSQDKDKNDDVGFILPSAKCRSALDLVANGSPERFETVNMRTFLQDLLNWDGGNKVNKPLINNMLSLVSQHKTYPLAAELCGFLAAFSPLLEADNLNRIVDGVKDNRSSFAPTMYPLKFSAHVRKVFGHLSQQRIERLAISIFNESHHGRWWNMTAGIDNGDGNDLNYPGTSGEDTFNKLKHYYETNELENFQWDSASENNFAQYIASHLDEEIALLSEKMRERLIRGETVNPDVAIFLSVIPWLAPYQRPESPINSLLRMLAYISEYGEKNGSSAINKVKKPNTIKDMFPELTISSQGVMGHINGIVEYPFPENVMALIMSGDFSRGLQKMCPNIKRVALLGNRSEVASNAKFMGNCTLTYENRMRQGTYMLFLIEDTEGSKYNLSFTLSNELNSVNWSFSEINCRYNGTRPDFKLPKEINDAGRNAVHLLPPTPSDYSEHVKKAKKNNHNFSYTYMV